MRAFAVIAALAAAVGLSGCRTTEYTVDQVYSGAHAGGEVTALVMNETSLDTARRSVIRDIMTKVRDVTPEVGQPLEAAWTPVAQAHVDRLLSEGRITSATAVFIMAGFRTCMAGVNALEQQYPQVRTGRDYLDAFVKGYVTGFLARFEVKADRLARIASSCVVKTEALGLDRELAVTVRAAARENGIVK